MYLYKHVDCQYSVTHNCADSLAAEMCHTLTLIVILLSASLASTGPIYPQPEQIHLSVTNDPTEMVVTWVTLSQTNESTVEYGTSTLNLVASGVEESFLDGGTEKRHIYMHRVTLTKLKPATRYFYHVGSKFGVSDLFTFLSTRPGQDWHVKVAMFGDMGNINGKSIPALQRDSQSGLFDIILHVGDFAYNMDSENARVGDEFMRQIEPIAAYVPYMTCPGNHEQAYNFSNYKSRFSMPGGDGQGSYYSFNFGRVHVVAFSSEFYYYTNYGWKQSINQYDWLEQDLIKANLPQNRAKYPWIVAIGHRPMYCSNNDDPEHCTNVDNLVRTGFPIGLDESNRRLGGRLSSESTYMLGLEDLFYKYGVDLIVGAHEHSYERMWPVYNRKVCNGTKANPYFNPPAPVHIITGSAGCQEGTDPFIPNGLPWSAFRTDDYGFTKLVFLNSTHMSLDQVSVDEDEKIIDSIMYVREKHGAGVFNCK